MTIKKLLLILFLYVLLVWIVAAYFYAPSSDFKTMTAQGLFYTAIGVGALLVFVLFERVFGWFRARKAQQASKPAAAPTAAGPKVMTEDEAALMGLIKEADQRLASAPGGAGVRSVLDLPIFLALGSERAGKTAVIHNSGLEPSLLAGQVLGGAGMVAPTRIANLWLAHQSLLLEVSGRVFNGERLGDFLSCLQPPAVTGWKSWFAPRRKSVTLRGVLLFFDARDFMGTPEPSKLDRAAQSIRTRLLSAANVFGAEFPVYVLFTNTDALPYFDEFFSGLAEAEAGQVLGVISDSPDAQSQGRVWAETETKRLNSLFQTIFLRLSDRRLMALNQETDPARKPPIYEFPREFRRIRAPLVQFLIDVFKPDALNVGPRLRGVFFTGVRKVEETGGAPAADVSGIYRARPVGPDATQIFAPGAATTIFRAKGKSGGGRLAEKWAFTAEFFQRVLSQDRPYIRQITKGSGFDKHRELALGIAAGLGLLFAIIWTVSWIENWGLVSKVQDLIKGTQTPNAELSMSNLQALDKLRAELEELQQGGPLHMRWGLYQGDDLKDLASRQYFARLKQLSLDRINQTLASELRLVGSPGQQDDSDTVYGRLKTHRTITTRACDVDQTLIRKVLTGAVPEAHNGLGDQQRDLLTRQLNFYVTQLNANKKLPVALGEDSGGVKIAQAYLREQSGLDQKLRDLLSEISGQLKDVTVPAEYRAVLTGQQTVRGVFSKPGSFLFEDRVKNDNLGSGEQCVMGDSLAQQAQQKLQKLDNGTKDRIRSLYYHQYANAWRDFLASYKVIRYGNIDDAVQKLTTLSDSRSPLLGVVRLAAENTNFPPPKPGELSFWQKYLGSSVGQTEAAGTKLAGQVGLSTGTDDPLMTPADVFTLFQPVLFITPPTEQLLVSANNKDYLDGLRKLKDGLDTYAKATKAEQPMALAAANAALTQARAAHTMLSDKFVDVGKEGLNKVASDLLKQPLDLGGLLPANQEVLTKGGKNNDLKKLCTELAPTLKKFPFNTREEKIDASLSELEAAFAPNKGLVSKFVQQSAADLVVLKDTGYEDNPALQGLKVAPELKTFLNRSLDLRKAFFGASGIQKIQYTLRKPQGQKIGVLLTLDGQELGPQEVLRKTFTWSGTPGAVAEGYVVEDTHKYPFGSFNDLWAVFRLFQAADERPLLQRLITWSTVRGQGGARPQALPVPGSIEVVDFPGGVDLFNPKFFDDLRCPAQAVLPN